METLETEAPRRRFSVSDSLLTQCWERRGGGRVWGSLIPRRLARLSDTLASRSVALPSASEHHQHEAAREKRGTAPGGWRGAAP